MQAEDERWMQRALVLAKRAWDADEVPVGAVLVDAGGEPIGEGFNRPISSCDPSAHAEVIAIRDGARKRQNYRLPGTTLYVTIEPCTMCLGAIIHARIARVIYGVAEPKAGVLASHPVLESRAFLNHFPKWESGVCEQQCADLIQQFFREKRLRKKKNFTDAKCK